MRSGSISAWTARSARGPGTHRRWAASGRTVPRPQSGARLLRIQIELQVAGRAPSRAPHGPAPGIEVARTPRAGPERRVRGDVRVTECVEGGRCTGVREDAVDAKGGRP